MSDTKVLSKEKIAEIRARAEKATPGPHQTRHIYRMIHAIREHGLRIGLMMGPDTGKDWNDADLWANSQEDINTLCDSHDAQATNLVWVLHIVKKACDLTDVLLVKHGGSRTPIVAEGYNGAVAQAVSDLGELLDAQAKRIEELEATLSQIAESEVMGMNYAKRIARIALAIAPYGENQ